MFYDGLLYLFNMVILARGKYLQATFWTAGVGLHLCTPIPASHSLDNGSGFPSEKIIVAGPSEWRMTTWGYPKYDLAITLQK
jgi:hypothetical protein